MSTVELEHEIGDKVTLIDIEMRGRVTGQLIDEQGIQYRVVYWNNGERYTVWMFDWELKREEAGK